ncbi:MAG: GTPase HflX [Deltaproteobacteria bacterium]|nr:GTPase HflX [Deltaproteobacteria bacterium]
MARHVTGNISGLAPSEHKKLERLFGRKLEQDELVSLDLAREIYRVAHELKRRIGVLISREGRIVEVFVGTKTLLYLPDLGRYRLGAGRLRRLRLLFSDLSTDSELPHIPSDIYADLEKLRLDLVASIRVEGNRCAITYAHLIPADPRGKDFVKTESVKDLGLLGLDFGEFMSELEGELARSERRQNVSEVGGALLVGVYEKSFDDPEGSIAELAELARTAGVTVLDRMIQRRTPDPKTLLGKGKLQEVVLHCLRLGADMIIFDTELKPSQWRAITNATDLKVIDRSMLILDIFAQRASSSDGRLQVELAQLKYNLPRLVEKDAGLSRLTGGIGGRGPGETKLEVGRRRTRDRISELEKRIDQLGKQRELKRGRRVESKTPMACIIGYTNVGKSTIFNALTKSQVIAENKLFATLDPAQRRLVPGEEGYSPGCEIILSDTVGFIRNLPNELRAAFRATLEELRFASLLVHVLDASDSRIRARKQAVENVLQEMNLGGVPQLIVINKCDQSDSNEVDLLAKELNALPVSAITGAGLDKLRTEIRLRIAQLVPREAPGWESRSYLR